MKRFNYTGRKKILKQDIRIRLHGDFNEPPVVDFQVDLEGYDFQLDAEVFLEAWDVTRFMRFKVGKVSGSIRKNNIPKKYLEKVNEILKFMEKTCLGE